jgi:hypothetical protein
VLLDWYHRRQPAAREDFVHDEFEEAQVPHPDRQIALFGFLLARLNDRVQQHLAIGGNRS